MTKEIKKFAEQYPAKEVTTNPFVACEAIGYLKHLKLTSPEASEWIDTATSLLLIVISDSLK